MTYKNDSIFSSLFNISIDLRAVPNKIAIYSDVF
jgi:hypothetical protein